MRKAVLSKPQGQKMRENLVALIDSLNPVVASNLFNEFVSNTTRDAVMVPCSSFGNCTPELTVAGMIFKLIIEEDGTSGSFDSEAIKDIKEYCKVYFEHYALEWFYFVVNYRDKAVLSSELAWNKIVQPILRDKITFHDRTKLQKGDTSEVVQEGGQNGSSD